MHGGQFRARADVVAVHGDIDDAGGEAGCAISPMIAAICPAISSARRNAGERDALEVGIPSMISCAMRRSPLRWHPHRGPGAPGGGVGSGVMFSLATSQDRVKGTRKRRRFFGPGVRSLPLGPPGRAMFHDPIEQGFFKSDVVSGFFTLDPFVAQDLFALRQELLVSKDS